MHLDAYRSRRLSALGIHSVNSTGEIALHALETQPIDVGPGVAWRGDGARRRTDHESISLASLARGREVPLWAEARARERVGDEVVLAKYERRVQLREGVD